MSKSKIAIKIFLFTLVVSLIVAKLPDSVDKEDGAPKTSFTFNVYTTFFGGNGLDYAKVRVDALGYIYVAMDCGSSNLPTTIGAYDTTFNGGTYDVAVAKFSPDGKTLIWCTYLGTTSLEEYGCMDVDAAGNVYIAGTTQSSVYPGVAGSFDSSFNGGFDIYVTKLNSSGSNIIWSTYLGGSVGDYPHRLYVDTSGKVYVTGSTWSSGFPTTSGAYDTSFNGGNSDAYLTIINPDGKTLNYSTFMGGSGDESFDQAKLENDGTVLTFGKTSSSNFPTTVGANDTIYNGGSWDVIVVRHNTTAKSVVASTYVGGSLDDMSSAMQVDNSGNIYIVGSTTSTNFPTTPGVFNQTFGSANDGFITSLNKNLSTIRYSTYIGGGGDDYVQYIDHMIISGNAVWCMMQTSSSLLKTTPDAFDPSFNGGTDVYLFKMSSDLSQLLYGTYIGGTSGEFSGGLQTLESGALLIAVNTQSSEYPVTGDAYDSVYNAGWDGTFSMLRFGIIPDAPVLDPIIPAINTNGSIDLIWGASPNAISYNVYRYGNYIDQINSSVTRVTTTNLLTVQDNVSINGTYFYAITALNASGESLPSNSESVIVTFPPPAKPNPPVLDAITPAISTNGSITLTWSLTIGANSYGIYRYGSHIDQINGTIDTVTTTNLLTASDTITMNGTYYYAISAINASGESGPSNSEMVMVAIPPQPKPAAPVLNAISPATSSTGNISLSWSSSIGATSYNIYIDSNPISSVGGSVVFVKSTSQLTTNDLRTNGTYYYVITAVNSSGESAPSNSERVTVIIQPPCWIPSITNGTWLDLCTGSRTVNLVDNKTTKHMEVLLTSTVVMKMRLSYYLTNPKDITLDNSKEFWSIEFDTLASDTRINLKFLYDSEMYTTEQENQIVLYGYKAGQWEKLQVTKDLDKNQLTYTYNKDYTYFAITLESTTPDDEEDFSIPGYPVFELLGIAIISASIILRKRKNN